MSGNKRVATVEFIKRINRSLVLDMIKECQPVSRAQIARELSLSKTTVSLIVEDLLKKSMIIDLGECTAGKGAGRPAWMLGFNPDSAYGIGVSIARSETLLVITNLLGSCVFKTTFPSTNQLSALIERIQHGISESGLADQTISGLGISVPGTVTREGIVLHSGTLNWHHYNAGSVLQSQFPYPVFLGNDANCAALGERWLGAGKGTDDMLFLSIGNGVGGAVICNGKVVDGSHSLSGEICYQIGTDDIRQKRFNVLGETGVFEQKVSAHTLSKTFGSCQALFDAYCAGDILARETVSQFVLELSVVLANFIGLLNPEQVILGGPVIEAMSGVIQEIRDTAFSLSPMHAEISLATLGKYASAYGAIADVFERVEQG